MLLAQVIKIVHLVSCESFNGRHNKYSDHFLLEERGDRSLALLDILKIFYSQLVTKRRHRYLRETYLWLSAVLLEMSPSQMSRKLALKPRLKSLLSEKLTVKAFCSLACSAGVLLVRANFISLRSFIWPAMFNFELVDGGGRRGRNFFLIDPLKITLVSKQKLVIPQ